MAGEQPIWRQALNDEHHPLYRAAWLIFSGSSSPEYTTKIMEDKKDSVIPFLLALLNEESLYKSKSLGQGKAPFRAMTPLIDWKVTEALPAIFKAVEWSDLREDIDDEDYDDEYTAIDAIMDLIPNLTEEFADTLFAQAQAAENPDLICSSAFQLAKLRPTDPQLFEWLTQVIEKLDIVWNKEQIIHAMLEMAIPNNKAWVEDYIKRKNTPQHLKIAIRNYLREIEKHKK